MSMIFAKPVDREYAHDALEACGCFVCVPMDAGDVWRRCAGMEHFDTYINRDFCEISSVEFPEDADYYSVERGDEWAIAIVPCGDGYGWADAPFNVYIMYGYE